MGYRRTNALTDTHRHRLTNQAILWTAVLFRRLGARTWTTHGSLMLIRHAICIRHPPPCNFLSSLHLPPLTLCSSSLTPPIMDAKEVCSIQFSHVRTARVPSVGTQFSLRLKQLEPTTIVLLHAFLSSPFHTIF